MTFLFTDIEGSTRRWEADPDGMRAALAAHDDVLRAGVEDNGGWLFKHTGDGVCAAFASAGAAVDAAVTAQRALGCRCEWVGHRRGRTSADGDYFGTVLEPRGAGDGAGHGGQVLVAALPPVWWTAWSLIDLGEYRLRDLSGTTRLFQVRAPGLRSDFPPLRTMDTVPGNLPVQPTSFVGRELEVRRVGRFGTCPSAGDVDRCGWGRQDPPGAAGRGGVAASSPTGRGWSSWRRSVIPRRCPTWSPTALGVPPAGTSVTDSVVEALTGRHVLIVLDNCEHVLDAAGDCHRDDPSRTATVKVMATSPGGIGVAAEHLWPVPSLDTMAGIGSAAVTLFAERAKEVTAGFSLDDPSDAGGRGDCRRLDGIALAIELAAARMVSMAPAEVLERLADRFRLLAGSRRGLERHQTLRQAVGWSFDLLGDDECDVLCSCSVFADGFDLGSATRVCGGKWDEYAVLDGLDSLVRKSLITAERVGAHTRYRMLETIRQYAEDRLLTRSEEVRDRHATYFASVAVAHWETFDGPAQRAALDWVDAEFGNLRAGFRWSADRGDLDTAIAIAAHTAMLGLSLQRYEAVGWAEELLATGAAADTAQLPRLYTAASLCSFMGRPGDGLDYARSAVGSGAEAGRDPFDPGWSRFYEAVALRFCGAVEGWMDVCAQMAGEQGLERVLGLSGLLYGLPNVGRTDEARGIADETLVVVRAYGNPWIIAFTMDGYARAYAGVEPDRALAVLRQGLEYTREHRLLFLEAFFTRDAAALEAWHGEFDEALELFDRNIDSLHRAGDVAHLTSTLGYLVVLLDRIAQPVAAATVYGTTTRQATVNRVSDLAVVVDRLRAALGSTRFDECLAVGAAMNTAEAAQFARQQIPTGPAIRDRTAVRDRLRR